MKNVRQSGFTLLEVLVALVILSTAFLMVYSTFSTTSRAWRDGSKLLQNLRHGDFVMEQLVSALRSAAYFEDAGPFYGFRMEDNGGGSAPTDWASWVTASPAFLPPNALFSHSMHRLEFTIDDNADGDPSVTVRAYPYLADEEEAEDAETWHVSTEVQGFNIEFYNPEDEVWEDEWEDTNEIPALVRVTLVMPPKERYEKPLELSRLVEIPVAGGSITGAVSAAKGSASGGGPANSDGQANGTPASDRAGSGGRPNNTLPTLGGNDP